MERASLEAPLLSPVSLENSFCQDCPGEVPHEALWGEGDRGRWTGQDHLLYWGLRAGDRARLPLSHVPPLRAWASPRSWFCPDSGTGFSLHLGPCPISVSQHVS